ncbi:MAG: hypothetical protein IT289_06960 [Oligoflexia bacterium]|nr:hypothetical protein [Oligoflexia bacterium]
MKSSVPSSTRRGGASVFKPSKSDALKALEELRAETSMGTEAYKIYRDALDRLFQPGSPARDEYLGYFLVSTRNVTNLSELERLAIARIVSNQDTANGFFKILESYLNKNMCYAASLPSRGVTHSPGLSR